MGFSDYLENTILDHEFGAVAYTPPTTHYVGLSLADAWEANASVSVGKRVAVDAYPNVIFECTTGGTTGASEPTWDATPGNTTADNTAVWTCRSLDDPTYFVEPSGGGYARVAVTNDTTTWPVAANGSKSNGITITFPESTGAWGTTGRCTHFGIFDAASGGNFRAGGKLNTARTVDAAGITLSFGSGQLTITLD